MSISTLAVGDGVIVGCRDCGLPLVRARPTTSARCSGCRRSGGYAGHLFDGRFRVLKRERRHPSAYRYVRKVRGRLYQARPWVGGVGSVNLGLYPDEWTANRAVKAVLKELRGVDAVAVWRATEAAIRAGHVAAHVLPKWVHRLPGGRFGAKCRVRGAVLELGPFAGPEEACRAMAAHLAARPRGVGVMG
jgi:hypothetical protein